MPGLRVEQESVRARIAEECADPEWNEANDPSRAMLERFPPEFDHWVNWLMLISLAIGGGMPMERNSLTFRDWLALGIIKKKLTARTDI